MQRRGTPQAGSSRRRWAPAAAIGALVLVSGAAALGADDGGGGTRAAVVTEATTVAPPPEPTTTTTSTTTTSTTTTSTTSTTAPPAPATTVPVVAATVPIAPPTDERAPEPEVVIGRIEIPRIGLAAPLNEGISLNTIDRGPSHWPGSAMPGQVGNVVVAGHRVTRTRPFRDIDRLVAGDEVVLTAAGIRATYVVKGTEVVTPDAMRIVDPTPTATATLFACHPPGSARYRYVVTADLLRTEVVRP